MKPRVIVIGASLGGLIAIETLLSHIDPTLNIPIAIVQHRAKTDRKNLLASLLQAHTQLRVVEAEDRDELLPGTIYLAPPDYHLLIEQGYLALSLDAPVNYARPSVDLLFETAAFSYGAAALGIVLTGGNSDGAMGAKKIKENGGMVIVQEPKECENSNMPKAALAATTVDFVLTIKEIAAQINEINRGTLENGAEE